MRNVLPFTLLTALAVLPAPTPAAESYDGCRYVVTTLPVVLSAQGTWCLKGDLSTAITSGNAITIAANNVTLDCNGFKLGGLAAGPSTVAYGVFVDERSSVVVRRCNVRGFAVGVRADGSTATVIEDNVFDGNTITGVTSYGGSNTVIRRNLINDTGGTPFDTGAAGIVTWGEAHVIDNIISGVAGDGLDFHFVYGVQANNAAGTFTGNHIGGLVPDGGANSVGLSLGNPAGAIAAGNLIDGGGLAGATGISCSSALAVARDNTMMRVDSGVPGCASVGNHIGTD